MSDSNFYRPPFATPAVRRKLEEARAVLTEDSRLTVGEHLHDRVQVHEVGTGYVGVAIGEAMSYSALKAAAGASDAQLPAQVVHSGENGHLVTISALDADLCMVRQKTVALDSGLGRLPGLELSFIHEVSAQLGRPLGEERRIERSDGHENTVIPDAEQHVFHVRTGTRGGRPVAAAEVRSAQDDSLAASVSFYGVSKQDAGDFAQEVLRVAATEGVPLSYAVGKAIRRGTDRSSGRG